MMGTWLAFHGESGMPHSKANGHSLEAQ